MAKKNNDFFETKKEWSVIKDRLLGCYIRPYFQKLLSTKIPIYYIDCFAGKGKFDDGEDGSPIIALKARKEALQSTNQKNINNIYTYFIDKKYANDLRVNISSFIESDNSSIINGLFEEHIGDLLKNLRSKNVFLYIDPYGIEALDSQILFPLSNYGFASFEMLINFNSFGFFRDACQAMNVSKKDDALSNLDELVEYDPTKITNSPESISLLTRIVGSDFWKDVVLDYKNNRINGYQAEEIISKGYKRNLRKYYKFVLDMPISLKPGQHSKYRMIHVCNHVDGCYLMAHDMQNRDKELATKVQHRQPDLFEELGLEFHTGRVDHPYMTQENLKQLIKDYISTLKSSNINYNSFMAHFANEYNVFPFKSIQTALRDLEKEGVIRLERIPAYTLRSQPSTFWEESGKKKLLIHKI